MDAAEQMIQVFNRLTASHTFINEDSLLSEKTTRRSSTLVIQPPPSILYPRQFLVDSSQQFGLPVTCTQVQNGEGSVGVGGLFYVLEERLLHRCVSAVGLLQTGLLLSCLYRIYDPLAHT